MQSYSTLITLLAIGISVSYAVSRLLLFLSRRWDGSYVRILVANAMSVALCIAVYGLSKSDPLGWAIAIMMFGPAQIVVLLVDIGRKFKQSRARDA